MSQPNSRPRTSEMCIASGRTHPDLARDLADAVDAPLVATDCRTFSNGELYVEYEEPVRGKDVFVVQAHDGWRNGQTWTVNDAIQEQILLIDAARMASAQYVTAVVPYLGYSRQDKKDDTRTAISAQRVVRQLESAGADSILAMELHTPQIQGFSKRIPIDEIKADDCLLDWFVQRVEALEGEPITFVAADAGAVKRTKRLRQKAQRRGVYTGLAVIDKERSHDSSSVTAGQIIGDIAASHCVVVEDIVDTGKTLVATSDALQAGGAASSDVLAAHAILSGNAAENISQTAFEHVVVTDSTPTGEKALKLQEMSLAGKTVPKLEVVRSVPAFRAAVLAIHHNESVSGLSDELLDD